jgi:hypothetical protein
VDEDFDEGFDMVEIPVPLPPPRPSAARRKTAAGAVIAAALLGVQEVFEGPKEDPVVLEVQNSGGNDDEPVALDLDPYDPSASIAVVRPWLQEP